MNPIPASRGRPTPSSAADTLSAVTNRAEEVPMKKLHAPRARAARTPLAVAVALGLLAAPAVQAFEFENGEWSGSLDTTVSYGYSWRVDDRDEVLAQPGQVVPGPRRRDVGRAGPAHVVGDDVVGAGQRSDHAVPDPVGVGVAVDQDDGGVRRVAVLPDGQREAVGGGDGAVLAHREPIPTRGAKL